MIRLACLAAALSVFAACSADRPGCLDNASSSCLPAAPCDLFADACAVKNGVEAFVVSDPSERPKGIDAQAGEGDFVLQNDFLTAVINAPDHQFGIAVGGGDLIDLAPRDHTDHLVEISHAVGILPRDQVVYTKVDLGPDPNTTGASVIARGHLFGDDRVIVVTRYELRGCDRALRIRTEIYNGGRIAQTFFLSDAYFWGDRSVTPFAPVKEGGFSAPPLNLLDLDTAYRDLPYLAASSHTGFDDASYATVACDRRNLSTFNTTTLSAGGTTRQVVMPGDGVAFERMIFVANGSGVQGAQAQALRSRLALFGEASVTVRGTVKFKGDVKPSGLDREASLVFWEGDVGTGTPWAEVVPDATGRYEVQLPAAKHFSVEITSFGRTAIEPVTLDTEDSDLVFDVTDIPRPATLDVIVREGSTPLDAELVLVPTEATNEDDVVGSLHGKFGRCAPYLGPPHGASPACNRALAPNGRATFGVPPGEYWVYATHGPGYTLQRERVKLASAEVTRVTFSLTALPELSLGGALSADFHVHGGRSFDTSIPDQDRVQSFLTSGVQVIAATDHDVVGSYEDEIARIGAQSRIFVVPGVEMTGLVLFYKRDKSNVPRTLGHFNFWPMDYDPSLPRNGAPWDELMEPGQLYDTMAPLIGKDGVMQLNHPYAESKLGRDEGYATAIGYDVRKKIPDTPDTTPEGQWRKKPGGGFENVDHHAQEVMNGSSIGSFLQYRTLWFSFMRQGIVRAGTANSDTHTLNVEQTGYPRNIVLGGAGFGFPNVDLASFNAAVRDGRMIGTNGPLIEATTVDSAGMPRGPSVTPFQPGGAKKIHVRVLSPPWIPVDELRIVVNGDVAKTIPMSAMSAPADPFGATGTLRYEGDVDIGEFLTSDGFIVFEAGMTLPPAADLDPVDGVPDTFDWNGDGNVDEHDQDVEDKVFPARAKEGEPRRHIDIVSPDTWPNAFTNPFVVDLAGDGWEAPGL